jgi:acetyl esterase/lipase
MRKYFLAATVLLASYFVLAQKKPLDHSVYDGWQSIGERMISNDGKWVVYTTCPQEGDTTLVIQQTDNKYRKEVERGYGAAITEDNRFVVFRIKPFQKELREARIKNRRPDDMPKDSLGIFELGKDSINKIAKVRSYKTPAKASGWVAYWMEKSKDAANGTDGADLVLKNLATGENKTFNLVTEYYFDKNGTKLLVETCRSAKDTLSKSYVLLHTLTNGKTDTLSRGGNDFRNFVFDETGSQLAFLAEREAEPKALQKFYSLWYYRAGTDSATALVNKNSVGMKLGMTVSENGTLWFSKSGQRLFFAVAPLQPPKDTTIIEADLVKLDIWHYNDDYLQTQQLVQLNAEQRRNYLAVYFLQENYLKQLGSREIPQVMQTNEGDGDMFVGITDAGKRKEAQWVGTTRKDIYAINVVDGSRKLVKQNLHGQTYPSSTGKYIMWYDRLLKNYFLWDGVKARSITSAIKVPLYNVEFDMPDAPPPYGVMGWHEGDSAVYVYDQYDIWKIETGIKPVTTSLTGGKGRKTKKTYRYQVTDPEKRFFITNENILLRTFDEISKSAGLADIRLNKTFFRDYQFEKNGFSIGQLTAKKYSVFIYTRENFRESPDLYFCSPAAVYDLTDPAKIISLQAVETKLTSLNPQQKNFIWGTAELFKWKTTSGKSSEGILYKPENFDPNKKYPVVIYFYEKLSDGLHDYIEPSPVRSSINVSFFVSNGYVVFYPDIAYGTGHPGKDAFDYVVSGAKALITKYKWIDGKHMGIQGHSWGGYQVAYLVTKTNMFKAAWAGAPVINMTSAYGGIRYGTGISRQWQYEKSQSRIGKNLWEGLPQYLESSPLFTLNRVSTPVAILHNDNDDAVPYTQGLEMFTALKRLGKKVWLINYNGEPHGVLQRKNRKDLSARFDQFFGWLLKNEQPAKWLSDGVPALKKGKDWGLEY